MQGDPSVQGEHLNSSRSISSSRVSSQSTATVPLRQGWDNAACQRRLQQCVLCDRDSGARTGAATPPRRGLRAVISDSALLRATHHQPNPFMINREQALCYLLQLLLNHALLLGDVLELLGVLLWELSPSLLGGTLLS